MAQRGPSSAPTPPLICRVVGGTFQRFIFTHTLSSHHEISVQLFAIWPLFNVLLLAFMMLTQDSLK